MRIIRIFVTGLYSAMIILIVLCYESTTLPPNAAEIKERIATIMAMRPWYRGLNIVGDLVMFYFYFPGQR